MAYSSCVWLAWYLLSFWETQGSQPLHSTGDKNAHTHTCTQLQLVLPSSLALGHCPAPSRPELPLLG